MSSRVLIYLFTWSYYYFIS